MPCSSYVCKDVDESTVTCECNGYKCHPPANVVAGNTCECEKGFYENPNTDNCLDMGKCYNATLQGNNWTATCQAVGPECVVRSDNKGCICGASFQDSPTGCVKLQASSQLGYIMMLSLLGVFACAGIIILVVYFTKRAAIKKLNVSDVLLNKKEDNLCSDNTI